MKSSHLNTILGCVGLLAIVSLLSLAASILVFLAEQSKSSPTMSPPPTPGPPQDLPPKEIPLGPATLRLYDKNLSVASPGGGSLTLQLDPRLGWAPTVEGPSVFAFPNTGTKLTFTQKKTSKLSMVRLELHTSTLFSVSSTVALAGAHWYGGAEVYQQHWPLESCNVSHQPYTTHDIYQGAWGGVMERYFLSSAKIAMTLDDDVPLWAGLNEGGDGLLRLTSQIRDSLYQYTMDETRSKPFMAINFLTPLDKATSLRDFHLAVLAHSFERPTALPSVDMMRYPIWSTWAKYKKDIDTTSVLEFANKIKSEGYENAQIEIDDEWATAYGDMAFNRTKFPDPKGLTDQLHRMGFNVTLWTHPFANYDSQVGTKKSFSGMWVQDQKKEPGAVHWWDGVGVMVDPTNATAAKWFVGRMKKFLAETGVDSYKFDAGETNWLPPAFKLAKATYPNQATHDYVKHIVAELGDRVETRVGSGTQACPIFVRIMDKDSVWGHKNGLATVLTVTLTFGLLGYPFVLPDMIGGNAYGNDSTLSLNAHVNPDKELYLRWLQASALLPGIQFSIAPWDYPEDPKVAENARDMLALREKHFPAILAAANQSLVDGSPIVRPLWWEGDESEAALTSADEFYVGKDLLVAPVMAENAVSRQVYLPEKGATWLCELDNQTHPGGTTITQAAGLYQLPTYVRQS